MFIIVENFYNNPIETREFALKQDFNVIGNYPGARTLPCSGEYITNIQKTLARIVGSEITYWPTEYNTSFQITTQDSKTWVHHDNTTEWAGVLYLTPNAPIESGTGIYRNKNTGIFQHSEDNPIDYNIAPSSDEDWELVAFAGNIFNRLVLYKGSYYHRSVLPGFGTSKEDGRLFQTFFFST